MTLHEIVYVAALRIHTAYGRAVFLLVCGEGAAPYHGYLQRVYAEDLLADFEQVGPTPNIYVDTTDPEVLHEMYLDTLTPAQQLLLPKFRSVSVDTALSLHQAQAETNVSLENEMRAKEAELDSRIAVLDQQIRNTYSDHGVGQTDKAEQNP